MRETRSRVVKVAANSEGDVSDSPQNFMRAYDKLPPEIRKWLREWKEQLAATSVTHNWRQAQKAGYDVKMFVEWMERAESSAFTMKTEEAYGPDHPEAKRN